MVEIIVNPRLVRARKKYIDNTKEFITEDWINLEKNLTKEEKALVEEAIAENWIIEQGEVHESGVFKSEGDIYSFRNKPGLNAICIKYKLYPDM